ncbi:MAG: alpha/beta hydrolase [Polyangiales bacterium]
MSSYAPFARGPHPVGVFSAVLHDSHRDSRKVELEVWYPAAARHRGADLAPATQDLHAVFGVHQVRQAAVRDAEPLPGRHPTVLFSHGIAGHRRQSTFLCTHLASHGYAVLAPDHGGHTLADLVALVMRMGGAGAAQLPLDVEEVLFGHVADRPRDLAFVLDALADGTLQTPVEVDLACVAVSGHSFGGFTALALASLDPRVVCAVALAPAGGEGPLAHAALTAALPLDFGGRVSTLYLALGRDSLLPLEGVAGLYRRTPAPARMFVLREGDHMHFCDRAESSHEFFRRLPPVGILADVMRRLPPFASLAPAHHGYAFASALTLAQLDATLRRNAEAEHFLAHDALAALAERGIAAE